MGITYLNGVRLKNAVIAAAQRVLDLQERLNKINVFPVPDGDTGTNMALTLKHVAEGAINAPDMNLEQMSLNLAESALMGARGNSGAILAQFFQGLAVGFHKQDRVGMESFAKAVKLAVAYAEGAIEEPREGTILSVMRDWADDLAMGWQQARDFGSLIGKSIERAQESLERTPRQLEVLAKAGVVDAGAQGFVHMIEGVYHLLTHGQVAWQPPEQHEEPDVLIIENAAAITYAFCTECLLAGQGMEIHAIREAISPLGDSLIVAGSTEKVKIHIHTNEPEVLFERASSFGTILTRKAENMREQHAAEHGKHGAQIALVVDSSCDLPTDYLIRHKIRLIPVTVQLDERIYLDRVNITAQEVYRQMGQGKWPKTSQPSPASFHQAFQLAREHHRQVIGIFLSSRVSGTYQAAKLAASAYPDMDIRIIDSRNVAGCMGHLARVAAESIASGLSLDEVEQRVLAARAHAKLFASFPTVEHMVRGGRLSKTRGLLAKVLGLVPILSFDQQGDVEVVAKTRTGLKSWLKVVALTKAFVADEPKPRFIVCHANHEEAAAYYQQALIEQFGMEDVDVLNISPTVGAHVGLGAAGICCYLPTLAEKEFSQ